MWPNPNIRPWLVASWLEYITKLSITMFALLKVKWHLYESICDVLRFLTVILKILNLFITLIHLKLLYKNDSSWITHCRSILVIVHKRNGDTNENEMSPCLFHDVKCGIQFRFYLRLYHMANAITTYYNFSNQIWILLFLWNKATW